MRLLVLAVVLLASGIGCSGDRPAAAPVGQSDDAEFGLPELVSAPAHLLAECQRTADAVGYPVPCPTRVPAYLAPTKGIGGCHLEIIGPGGRGGRCSRAWRGWVVGSSETNDQHLVINASPRALTDPAKVVNGPAWYPGARVHQLRTTTINNRRVRAVYVPPGTNEGSAFAHHVVLIWTVGRHTYAVGFHNVAGLHATLDLDFALVRTTRLVSPRRD